VPAIEVVVEIELACKRTPDSIWPRAVSMELLRARAAGGPYEPALSLGNAELARLDAALAPYIRRDTRATAADPPRRNYCFSIRDVAAEPGATHFYKLRFLDAGGRAVATSGYCSAAAVALPRAEGKTDEKGAVHVRWGDFRVDGTCLACDPAAVVSLGLNHEVARLPATPGGCKLPMPRKPPSGPRGPEIQVFLSLDVVLRRDEWRMGHGQEKAVDRIRLSWPVSEQGTSVELTVATGTCLRVQAVRGVDRWGRAKDGYALAPSSLVASHDRGARLLECRREPSRALDPLLPELNRVWQTNDGLYYETPGFPARYRYRCIWTDDGRTNQTSGAASALRSPIPTGLTACPAEGAVKLAWHSFPWQASDWAEGPYFIVRRSAEDDVATVKGRLQFSQEREVFRTRADTCEFVDRDVESGKLYFYTLEIQGVSKATSWSKHVGEYDCYLPVKVRMRNGFTGCPVMVVPGPRGPLSVALAPPSGSAPEVAATHAALPPELARTTWIRVVERPQAHALFEEARLAKLGTPGRQSPADQIKHALVADVVLRVGARDVRNGRNVDVWMEDFGNGRKERLLSLPAQEAGGQRVAARIVAELGKRFPEHAGRAPAAVPADAPKVRRVAVLGFAPSASRGTRLAEGALEDILLPELAANADLEVLERDRINAVLGELGLGPVVDRESCLQLGRLLKADVIMTGSYFLADDALMLSVRLVQAQTGQLLDMLTVSGAAGELGTLAKEVAQRVAEVANRDGTGTVSPLARWLETKFSKAADLRAMLSAYYDRDLAPRARSDPAKALREAKKDAFLAPESPAHHDRVGQECEKRGNWEAAYESYLAGIALAEKQEDPWRFYESAGRALAELGRDDEAVKLWLRAAADRKRRGKEEGKAYMRLATSLTRLGRQGEAIEALANVKRPSHQLGRAYEELGRLTEATETYAALIWPDDPPAPGLTTEGTYRATAGFGPGYPAAVRLLNSDIPPSCRTRLLEEILRQVRGRRPWQTLKAAAEVPEPESLPAASLWGAAEGAGAVRDHAREKPLLQILVDKRPHTLECMKALKRMAQRERENGNPKRAARLLKKAQKQKAKGDEADLLRQNARTQAELIARMGADGPKPRTPAPPPLAIYAKLLEKGWGLQDNGRTYVRSTDGWLSAVDSASREFLWHYDMRTSAPYPNVRSRTVEHGARVLKDLSSLAVLHENLVLVRDLINGVLHAVDSKTGRPRWVFTAWAPISPPVPKDGKVYVASALGNVYELSAASGKVLRRALHPPEMEAAWRERIPHLKRREGVLHVAACPHGWHDNQFTPTARETVCTVSLKEFRLTPGSGHRAQPIRSRLDREIANVDKFAGKRENAGVWDIVQKGGYDKAVPLLFDVLSSTDEDPGARRGALRALTYICGRSMAPHLLALLDDPTVAVDAVEMLGDVGDESHLQRVAALLDGRRPGVPKATVAALVKIGGVNAKPYLVHTLAGDKGPELQRAAAVELGKAGDSTVVPVLRSLLQSQARPGPRGDGELLLALSTAGDEETIADLERRLLPANVVDLALRARAKGWGWRQAQGEEEGRIQAALLCVGKGFSQLPQQRILRAAVKAVQAYPRLRVRPLFYGVTDESVAPLLIDLLPEWDESGEPWRGRVRPDPRISRQFAMPEHVRRGIVCSLERLTGQCFGEDKGLWELWRRKSHPAEQPR